MTKIKKAYESYRELGSYTRLFIKITLILFFSLLLAFVYTATATHSENYYELLLLSDELFQCIKSVLGIGLLGTLIIGLTEKKQAD